MAFDGGALFGDLPVPPSPRHVLSPSAGGEIVRTEKMEVLIVNGENGKFQELIAGMSPMCPRPRRAVAWKL